MTKPSESTIWAAKEIHEEGFTDCSCDSCGAGSIPEIAQIIEDHTGVAALVEALSIMFQQIVTQENWQDPYAIEKARQTLVKYTEKTK